MNGRLRRFCGRIVAETTEKAVERIRKGESGKVNQERIGRSIVTGHDHLTPRG